MNKTLAVKLATIIGLCMLFAIGLVFVSGIVNERQYYRQDAMYEIKVTHTDEQRLITPFLVLQTDQGKTPFFANTGEIKGDALVSDDEYRLGIYHAISYKANFDITQSFEMTPIHTTLQKAQLARHTNLPEAPGTANQNTTLTPNAESLLQGNAQTSGSQANNTQTSNAKPAIEPSLQLLIPVSDLRGAAPTSVNVNGKAFTATFAKSSSDGYLSSIGSYLMVDITPLLHSKTPLGTLNIDFALTVMGIDSLSVVPLGDNTVLSLASNWNEPKFAGQALPLQKNLGQEGFNATWQNSFVADANQTAITECLSFTSCHLPSGLATHFVDTNDTYTQTDRTIKYALLLIMISFGTFFLFEVLKNIRIHPVQYTLVAGALLVFYFLLLSFAEQVPFAIAYSIASVACVGLIGWYACYMLASIKRGLGFMALLGSLYAGFYVLLSAREMNLLLGSVFCFVLIAVVMAITRRIDWYGIDEVDDNA